MKKIYALLLLVFLSQTSCDFIKDDCGECFTPPPSFSFQLIGKNNGEDLFANKTFNIEDVSVTDGEGKLYEFELITHDNVNILYLVDVGWIEDPNLYTINLNDETSVEFDLDVDQKHSECCTYFEVINFVIYDYEYERSNNSDLIIVKM